jgi:hypothetical protein
LRGILRRTLAAYRRNWPSLVLLGAIVFVPMGLLEAATENHNEIHVHRLADLRPDALAPPLVLTVTSLLGEVFYAGAVAVILAAGRGGERTPLHVLAGRLAYGRLIAVDILFALGVAFGLVLFIVPGLVFFAWYVLAGPIVELEHVGVRAAFARSRRIVRGHAWRVLVVLLTVSILGEALSELVVELAHDTGASDFVVRWLGESLASIAVSPFYAIAATLITVTLAARTPAR